MTVRQTFALSLFAVLSACATTTPPAEPQTAPSSESQSSEADLEAIYGASMGRAGLTVRAKSNGCTKAEDFTVQMLDGWPAATVILKRKKPDLCRAFVAGGTDLTFGYDRLRIPATAAIVLANPLVSDPTPGR